MTPTEEMPIVESEKKKRGCLGFMWRLVRFVLVLLGLVLIFNVVMYIRADREAERIATTDHGKAFQSVDFRGEGPHGVLLLHGIHGTPQDFELLMGQLEKRKIHYYAPMLVEDRPSPADGLSLTAEDLAEHAEQAYQKLAQRCDDITLVGFSMGAVQATDLAAKNDAAGLALVSPAFSLTRRWFLWPSAEMWIRTLAPAVPFVPTGRASTEMDYVGLEAVALPGLAAMVDYSEDVLSRAEEVSEPILCVLSKGDGAIDAAAARENVQSLASKDKTFSEYTDSGHLILAEEDREEANGKIIKFIEEMSGTTPLDTADDTDQPSEDDAPDSADETPEDDTPDSAEDNPEENN